MAARRAVLLRKPVFSGWTGKDGARKPGAPAGWPFGTLSADAMAEWTEQIRATITRAQPKVKRKTT